ncbi:MAG: hypothetical protein NC318_00600 [Blautia sp.]|nr:hypothetical protein [Lachnoclostridium sp.]MCM1210086.1 hypothetical protein [Blautia sp.]
MKKLGNRWKNFFSKKESELDEELKDDELDDELEDDELEDDEVENRNESEEEESGEDDEESGAEEDSDESADNSGGKFWAKNGGRLEEADEELEDGDWESGEEDNDGSEDEEESDNEEADDEVEDEEDSDESETGDEEEDSDELEAGDEEEDEEDSDELEAGDEEEDEEDSDELEAGDEEEDEEESDDEEADDEEEDEEESDDEEADDEEEEDDEEYSLDEDLKEDSRRVYRRKRRIRNQIIAYGIVFICLVALAGAGGAAGRRISMFVKARQQAKQQEEQLKEQEEQAEQPPEEIVVAAPPVIEEEPEEGDMVDEQLEEFISSCILAMPLEDKVAGLFVVTPEALTGVGTVVQAGEGTQEALNQYAVGGLVYFSKNILNQEQLTGMLSNTVSMSKYPVFLAVDEEGGEVARIANSSISVSDVGDMAAIGAGGDAAAAQTAGMTIGSYLKDLGFNLDFAPVADLAGAGHESLGNRSFGTDPALTADMVSGAVEGIQRNGVSACLKHFPGLGSTQEDTHEGRVETTRTLEEMRESDFIPFQAGIDAGVNFIMVSHVTASEIDTDGMPSSLSRIMITDVLREELGYDGIVITDALDMSAISAYYTSTEAAVNAIKAGADMLLMPEDFEAAYLGLLAAVQDGTVSEERIDESLRRIYRVKYADKLK